MRFKSIIGLIVLGLSVSSFAQKQVIISQVQALPLSVHTPSDGSLVGGTSGTPSDPLRYAVIPSKKGQATAARFVVDGSTKTGTQYPDVEYYSIVSPKVLGSWSSGTLYFDYDITPDSNVEIFAQCLETDTIYVAKGSDGKTYKYNVSTQLDLSDKWEIDAALANGAWGPTGQVAGPLTPNITSHIEVQYSFNLVAHTGSVVSYSVNGVVHKLPAQFQNMPGTPSTWETGLYTQWQWGLNKYFGAYSVLVDNATYSK